MGLVIWLSLHRYNARSPKGIVKHLTESGGSYEVSAAYTRGVWNPAKPIGIDNPLFDKGIATYSLDDSGIVHLDFKSSSGHDQHLSGPVPESLVHPTVHQQHARTLMRRVLFGYLSFLVLGAAIGAVVAKGNIASHVLGGGLGLVVAMGVAVVLVRVLRVGTALRNATQKHEQ
jgi:hypothetical protein